MSIDRNNYEEYFILYLDNELDSESRRSVEEFALANPDLKAELDILLQSKFIPDTDIIFDNKESLLIRNSSSIGLANYEEWLISYVDNELTEEERKDVEQFVNTNPALQKELSLFQKTKLQPEAIVFPDKESLYRREEKVRVVAIRWWRIAAAAILLIGISTTAIILLNKKSGNEIKLADSSKTKKENSTVNPVIKQEDKTPAIKEEVANINSVKNDAPVKTENNSIASNKVIKNSTIEKKEEKLTLPVKQEEKENLIAKIDDPVKKSNNLPTTDHNPNVDANGVSKQEETNIGNAKTDVSKTLTNSGSNSDHTTVTPTDTHTYNTQTTAAGNSDNNSNVTYASQKSQKGGGLRGFLRKVTRTFEKTTKIKATDDDDRLLIAGLSFKLN